MVLVYKYVALCHVLVKIKVVSVLLSGSVLLVFLMGMAMHVKISKTPLKCDSSILISVNPTSTLYVSNRWEEIY